MRTKYTVMRIRAVERGLEVRVEVDNGITLRWVDLKVPWRMMNDQYRAIVEAMEDEAIRHLRHIQSQDPLPGID